MPPGRGPPHAGGGLTLFGFGRKRPGAASQLKRGRWRCASCDEEHGWPFDLAVSAPNVWPHEIEYAPNAALRMDGDFLSEDFCVLEGQHFMIRGVFPIPVIGMDDAFGFGCWSTLSRANFQKYVDGFRSGEYADMGPWDGWLMNRLAGFNDEPDPVAVNVQPRPGRLRPQFRAMDPHHPLGIAQREGITPERMLAVFARYGHAPG